MRARRADGFVLIVVLLAMVLLSALGSALVLTTSTESRIAANFGSSAEGLDAAEAIVEMSLAEIVAVPDWNQLLAGPFVPPLSTALRQAPAAWPTAPRSTCPYVVSMANCGSSTACTSSIWTWRRLIGPGGVTILAGRLFAHGRLADILPGTIDSPLLRRPAWSGTTRPRTTTIRRSMEPARLIRDADVIALRAEAFGGWWGT